MTKIIGFITRQQLMALQRMRLRGEEEVLQRFNDELRQMREELAFKNRTAMELRFEMMDQFDDFKALGRLYSRMYYRIARLRGTRGNLRKERQAQLDAATKAYQEASARFFSSKFYIRNRGRKFWIVSVDK